jgi:hypothetical protein
MKPAFSLDHLGWKAAPTKEKCLPRSTPTMHRQKKSFPGIAAGKGLGESLRGSARGQPMALIASTDQISTRPSPNFSDLI